MPRPGHTSCRDRLPIGRVGTTHRSLYTNPRGYDPTIPLTPDEVVAKFRSTVDGCLTEAAASELIDLILRGDEAEGVQDITRVMGLHTS